MFKQCIVLALTSSALACSAPAEDASDESFDGSLAARQDEIASGTVVSAATAQNIGAVAIYHKYQLTGGGTAWWPRPCSGTVIAYRAGAAYVWTARHCVTTENAPRGAMPPNPSDWLRVAPGVSPGPLVNGQPPSSAKPASSVRGMPVPADLTVQSENFDSALIVVHQPWAHLQGFNKAIFMGDPSGLPGVQFGASGYGISNHDLMCHSNPSSVTGVGTLRNATFSITQPGIRVGAAGNYSFTNGPEKRVLCGDSGGPDIAFDPFNMSYSMQLGTHSKGNGDKAWSTASGPWVSDKLEGVYVSPMSGTTTNLARGPNGNLILAASPSGVGLIYRPTDKRIYDYDEDLGNLYLQWNTSGDTFTLEPFNAAEPWQQWEVTARSYIRNPNNNLCVRHMVNGTVEPRTCPLDSDSIDARRRFTWRWRANP